MASIYAGDFSFNSSVYGIFPFLFPHIIILVGLALNAVADSLSPCDTKDYVTPCINPFLKFPNTDPA